VVIEAGPNPPQTQKVYLVGPAGAGGLGAGMMLEIMPRNQTPRHARNSHEPGLSHLAFVVADFDAALAHLRQEKVALLGAIVTAVGGGRLVSFSDLEGNMMQIVERR
jgi:catechol 2,3-dioxygenase-like lactoylglutathione lyase family enzyme